MREEYNRGISLLQILKQSDTAGKKKRRFGVGDVPPNIFYEEIMSVLGIEHGILVLKSHTLCHCTIKRIST